jgi:hypothetical protein
MPHRPLQLIIGTAAIFIGFGIEIARQRLCTAFYFGGATAPIPTAKQQSGEYKNRIFFHIWIKDSAAATPANGAFRAQR